jgi:WD40 repeat protein
VTASDNTVRVSDAQTGQESARITLDDKDDLVVSAAFSPDGQHVVIVTADTARISDARTGREIARLTHDRLGGPTAVSSDQTHELASEARARMELERLIEHNRGISAATAFSPDGRRVVTVSANMARISDAQTGKDIAQVTHEATVRSAAFSPDGRRIMTVSATIARVSDAQTAKEIARLTHDDDVESAAFSQDGQRIVTVSANTARLWDAKWLTQTGRKLIETVCDRKLVGASGLSSMDVKAAPVLVGREGEDVCQKPLFERLPTWFRQ